jgi:hypothetical protein
MKVSEEELDLIVERIEEEKCVPFLGAGVSLGFNGPGLPTASKLAEALAQACGYPGPDRQDIFRVAQYYELAKDRESLHRKIRTELKVPNIAPSRIHEVIAKLPIRHVLTTNFDDLMERALRSEGKKPAVAMYELRGDCQQLSEATKEAPLVYKLHGSLDRPDRKLIVTEDDVIEFISCLMLGEPQLPAPIKRLFAEQSILFIGYGLKDWTVRVMLRALRGGKGLLTPGVASFAIQRRPTDAGLAAEWEKSVIYFGKSDLRCYDMDAVEFIDALMAHYQKKQEEKKQAA